MQFDPIRMPVIDNEMSDKLKKKHAALSKKVSQLDADRNAYSEDNQRLRATPAEEVGPRIKSDLDELSTRYLELRQRELALRKEIAEFFIQDIKKELHDLLNKAGVPAEGLKDDIRKRLRTIGYVNINEPIENMMINYHPEIQSVRRRLEELQKASWGANETEIRHQGEIHKAKEGLDHIVASFSRSGGFSPV